MRKFKIMECARYGFKIHNSTDYTVGINCHVFRAGTHSVQLTNY